MDWSRAMEIMVKMRMWFVAAFLPSYAMAADFQLFPTQTAPTTYEFWQWDLKGQGSDGVLHGYVPRTGDVVEFYMRQVDCDRPDISCSFEIAIRKKEQP